MPNKVFTVKGAFEQGQVVAVLNSVEATVRKIESDFTKFKEADLNNLRDGLLAFGAANFNQLHSNFIAIEFVRKRGIRPELVPAIFDAIRTRYAENWRAAIMKGFATAADSAKGLQQKIQRNLLAEIGRENRGQQPRRGFFGLLLRIFGSQRANKSKTRRVSLGLVSYLKMLFRTLPRDMERDMMQFLIRFFENNTFLVVGGKVHNSASTCLFADGRVFTQKALDFITRSPALKVHLFHPNCRHRIVPPPKNYNGAVLDVGDLPAVQNGHFQGFHK